MDKNASNIDWKEESQRFNSVAALYEAFRPSYPNDLIETLLSLTEIQPGARILEIGSGTGQATALFAQRGFRILCIEPGRDLAAIAADKFRSNPNVEFECVRFEDWEGPPHEFDLVMSAQAFHWVPKEVGYYNAARALKESRHIALFWNRYPGFDEELRGELDQVYQKCAPGFRSPMEKVEEVIRKTEDEINASGYFEPVLITRFPWSATYTTQQYLGLLSTQSDALRLPESDRQALFAGIGKVIDKCGGYLEMPYLAVLFVAEKKPAGS